ncbi:3'5'-cyclic nucleotide phosphodiesterase family protein, partial [Planoprotostelium fungivorum]
AKTVKLDPMDKKKTSPLSVAPLPPVSTDPVSTLHLEITNKSPPPQNNTLSPTAIDTSPTPRRSRSQTVGGPWAEEQTKSLFKGTTHGMLHSLLEFMKTCAPLPNENTEGDLALANETGKLIGASVTSLFVYHRSTDELELRVKGMNHPRESKGSIHKSRFSADRGLVGHVLRTKSTMRIEKDPSRSDMYDSRYDDKNGINPTSVLYVPLFKDGFPLGVLQFMHMNKAFTQEDEDLIKMIDQHAAILLRNQMTQERMFQTRRRDRQLLESCRAISAELDVGPLSAVVSQRATKLTDSESCKLYLIDSVAKELVSIEPEKNERRYPLSKGIVGFVATTGEKVNIREITKDSRYDAEVDGVPGKQTLNAICVPIKNENRETLGVIQVINKRGGPFAAFDLETLELVSEQIFGSLSNAELFHKTLSGFNAALSTQQKYQSLLEVAESLTSQLDEDKLIEFIMKRAMELVNAERSALFLVDNETNELRSKVAEGAEEIRFPASAGIAGHVAMTGALLNISNAYADPRFNIDVDKKTGFKTRNILCMPIYNDESAVMGVTQLVNKVDGPFTQEDEEILKAFSIFCALLDVAVALSSEENIQPLLKSIMKHARRLVKADRASLFMLDPQNGELRSQIADGTEELRIPMSNGLVGYVAKTGEEISLSDVYRDSRFNPDIDRTTGYQTKSVLCMPIKDEKGKVIGVTQMINKREGAFMEEDKTLLKAFAHFAARSLSLNQSVPKPLKAVTLANDKRFEVTAADKKAVLSWNFDALSYSSDDLVRMCLAMFDNFGLITSFNIPKDRLLNLILDIRKSYRDVPYHNFYHAVDVTQVVFMFIWFGTTTRMAMTPLDILATLIAAMCHDIDHGGLNNAFHVKAQTPLALLYKDTSVLETHHCSRAISILSEVDNDILSELSEEQMASLWKTMISAILSTDMSLHFHLVKEFETIVTEHSFDASRQEHRKLLSEMVLKCADISNVIKPFPIAMKWAEIICQEFFNQGDMERQRGVAVSPLMNRATVIIPQMQLGFINSICVPIFSLFSSFDNSLTNISKHLKNNIQEWNSVLQTGMTPPK